MNIINLHDRMPLRGVERCSSSPVGSHGSQAGEKEGIVAAALLELHGREAAARRADLAEGPRRRAGGQAGGGFGRNAVEHEIIAKYVILRDSPCNYTHHENIFDIDPPKKLLL